MAECCELRDVLEGKSSYSTMPCHWYQFSVPGQFIPRGAAQAVLCSKTIRSTSRQEYNACKSSYCEWFLVQQNNWYHWGEEGSGHHVKSLLVADDVFSCSAVQLQSYSNIAPMSTMRNLHQPEEQTQELGAHRDYTASMLDLRQERFISLGETAWNALVFALGKVCVSLIRRRTFMMHAKAINHQKLCVTVVLFLTWCVVESWIHPPKNAYC